MTRMFYRCKSLEELNISSFNIKTEANLQEMFKECLVLKEENLCINDNNLKKQYGKDKQSNN